MSKGIVQINQDGSFSFRTSKGELLNAGDMVYDPDLKQHPARKIKRFFYPEGSETLYVQFDQGHGSNDGCLPAFDLTKIPPQLIEKEQK